MFEVEGTQLPDTEALKHEYATASTMPTLVNETKKAGPRRIRSL